MLKPVYEGRLNGLFRINEVAQAGLFVALDTENPGFVKVAGTTDARYLLSEDVKQYAEGDYRSPVKPVAGVNEKVMVYQNGGTYRTDKYDATKTYEPGEDLYFDGTQLTNVDPGDAKVVGVFIQKFGALLEFELAL